MIEVEKEIKYIINEEFTKNLSIYNINNKILNVNSYGKHLIVYYDFGTELYDRGDTFRLTYRKDRNRGTYKVNNGKENGMRVCTEYHFPFTKEVNPHKKFITELGGLPDTDLPFLERVCWVLVYRVKATLFDIPVEIDTCSIIVNGKRVIYREIEIEDTTPTKEWLDKLKIFGTMEESNKNKYQTVYDLVYG